MTKAGKLGFAVLQDLVNFVVDGGGSGGCGGDSLLFHGCCCEAFFAD